MGIHQLACDCKLNHPLKKIKTKNKKRHNAFISYRSLFYLSFHHLFYQRHAWLKTAHYFLHSPHQEELQTRSEFIRYVEWKMFSYYSSVISNSFTCEKCRLVSTLMEKIEILQSTSNSKRCSVLTPWFQGKYMITFILYGCSPSYDRRDLSVGWALTKASALGECSGYNRHFHPRNIVTLRNIMPPDYTGKALELVVQGFL